MVLFKNMKQMELTKSAILNYKEQNIIATNEYNKNVI